MAHVPNKLPTTTAHYAKFSSSKRSLMGPAEWFPKFAW